MYVYGLDFNNDTIIAIYGEYSPDKKEFINASQINDVTTLDGISWSINNNILNIKKIEGFEGDYPIYIRLSGIPIKGKELQITKNKEISPDLILGDNT
jgi:hypothetical protein